MPDDVRPELFPEVAAHPGDEAHPAPHRGHGGGGLAGRQPRVLNHVVERVPGVACPRRPQPPVASLRDHRGLERIAYAGPEALACRLDVAWILAPQGAEAALDGVRDGDVRQALAVS